MMDTVTTCAWEFSQTLNQNNIEGLARETTIIIFDKERPHLLNCFLGYGAYQKAPAGAFQQRRPCPAFINNKLR